MAEKRKGRKVPPEMLMHLAENARMVNLYAGLGPAGQQMFLESFEDSHESREKSRIEELTK